MDNSVRTATSANKFPASKSRPATSNSSKSISMPVPTDYEVLRLQTIAANHERIQNELKQKDSV